MGVREQIIFPEIDYDAVDQVRGLDITITTSAKTDLEAFALLEAFGFRSPPKAAPSSPARSPAGERIATQLPGRAALELEPEAAAEPEALEPETTIPSRTPPRSRRQPPRRSPR